MTFHCKAPFLFHPKGVFLPTLCRCMELTGWETTGNSDPETYLWPLRLICKITDTLTLSSDGVWITSAPFFYLVRNPFGLSGSDHSLFLVYLLFRSQARESCKGLIREKCFEDEKVFSCVRDCSY